MLVDKGNCKVEILGTDDGRYHLVIGKVGGDDWQYFESEIEDDELIGFEVNEKGQIISNGYFWDLITKELKSLLERYPRDRDLLWSIKAAENKYLPLLRWRVAVFAQRHNEREVGDRILDYCRVLAGRRWWF